LGNLAKFMITGLPKMDMAAFATLFGHGTGARETLETLGIGEAFSIITELRQQRRGEKVTRAGQRGE
jgi:hypothetical protein